MTSTDIARVLKQLANDRTAKLRSLNPKVTMLSGPASTEDQMYFRHAPIEALSHSTVPAALDLLGISHINVVDLSTDRDFLPRLEDTDLVVINLHGSPGEDGTVQGALDLGGIPYVGSGVEASVLGLNKRLARLVAEAAGIPVPYDVTQTATDRGDLTGALAIVKPLHGGSSIEMRVVPLDEGIAMAAIDGILVEEYLPGEDVTVLVVDGEDGPIALPGVMLEHPAEYYDFSSKFGAQWSNSVIASRPAKRIDAIRMCEEYAVSMHRAIGARHLSRSDFVIPAAGGAVRFLEINTLPGTSKVSNAAECAYAAGLTYADFVALVVGAAV